MNAALGTAAPMDGGLALRRALAVGLVVLLHLGLLWALMRGLQVRVVPPAPPPTVYLRILHVAPPRPIVQRPPPEPQPRPRPKPTPKPRPIEHHAPRPAPAPPPPRPAPPPPPAPPPTPAPAPVQEPPAPPAPAAPPAPPAPPPPPAPAAPPHPKAPAAPLAAALVCPHQVRPRMPDLAVEEGLGGTVTAQAVVRDGRVHDVKILSGPEVFHDAVRRAMRQYRCDDHGTQPVTVIQQFRFSVQ